MPAVLVGVVALAVAAIVNAVMIHEVGRSGDEPCYSRMAAHPPGPHKFPYAFRVGVPFLVHVLPFSEAFSWRLVTLVAIGAAAGALFALLREFDVSTPLATWLAVGFAVSPPLLVVLLRNGREVDPAAILVIVLGCPFIVRRARLALAVTLLVAATAHESCLFLIPLACAVGARRPIDLEALRDLALVGALPVALYLYLRTSIDRRRRRALPARLQRPLHHRAS